MYKYFSEKMLFLKTSYWLFLLLCGITFLTAITTGDNVFDNAWLILRYEAIFVSGFLIFRFSNKEGAWHFPIKSVGFWLVMAWFASITFSLFLSPYGLMVEWFAFSRYFQTLFHILFFFCVMDFLSHYKESFTPLLLTIPISIFILAFVFIGSWLSLDPSQEMGRYFWFRAPPLNAHIRITGFLITAAVAVLAPYFFQKEPSKTKFISLSLVSLTTWGFLFWCGGRGVMVSVWIIYALFFILLRVKKMPVKTFLLTTLVFMIGGILLSELFKVFPWNGIFQATSRTTEAGGDLYKLATGRPKLWGQVMESLRSTGSYLFGLGPQGYCYMPNRTFAFQPHNLFFQFLAEWGVIGTLLFFSLLSYGFIKGVKSHVFTITKELNIPALAAGAIIISLAAHSLVDGIFYHAQSSFYLALVFAIWIVPQKKK